MEFEVGEKYVIFVDDLLVYGGCCYLAMFYTRILRNSSRAYLSHVLRVIS